MILPRITKASAHAALLIPLGQLPQLHLLLSIPGSIVDPGAAVVQPVGSTLAATVPAENMGHLAFKMVLPELTPPGCHFCQDSCSTAYTV